MSMYELQDAELNGVEGQGYAYAVKTFRGKEFKGVFFANDDEALEEIKDQEEVEFSGTVYLKTRVREGSMPVNVTKTVSAGMGERADFIALEKP